MNRFLATLIVMIALAPNHAFSDAPVPERHSTVHIVFITTHSSSMMGGMGGQPTPMAQVGNAIVPTSEIRPIRITIDGDFVGHAMVGMWDIKPVFVLPKVFTSSLFQSTALSRCPSISAFSEPVQRNIS